MRKKIRKSRLLALFTALTLTFCGCDNAAQSNVNNSPADTSQAAVSGGNNNAAPTDSTPKVPVHDHDDMPEDTPWNNGVHAVMETETGYYYNQTRAMSLRYCEKGTDIDIYLCPKPECPHNGSDKCAATYKYMPTMNTLLYNGNIYIVAYELTEDRTAVSLYRARPDGSALDKIGEAYSVNYNGYGISPHFIRSFEFIIHRGYAYIPYSIRFSSGDALPGHGGLVRMDIETGKAETLVSFEDGRGTRLCERLRAAGDYVYYDLLDALQGDNGTYRYSLKDGSVSFVKSFDDKGGGKFSAVTSDRVYFQSLDVDNNTAIGAIDVESGEYLLDEFITVSASKNSFNWDFTFYNDMFFVYSEDNVQIYSKDGEKLGEITAPENPPINDSGYSYYRIGPRGINDHEFSVAHSGYRISNDKLYVFQCFKLNSFIDGNAGATASDMPENLYNVYSCPISDIIAGKGEWEYTYGVKGLWTMIDDGRSSYLELASRKFFYWQINE